MDDTTYLQPTTQHLLANTLYTLHTQHGLNAANTQPCTQPCKRDLQPRDRQGPGPRPTRKRAQEACPAAARGSSDRGPTGKVPRPRRPGSTCASERHATLSAGRRLYRRPRRSKAARGREGAGGARAAGGMGGAQSNACGSAYPGDAGERVGRPERVHSSDDCAAAGLAAASAAQPAESWAPNALVCKAGKLRADADAGGRVATVHCTGTQVALRRGQALRWAHQIITTAHLLSAVVLPSCGRPGGESPSRVAPSCGRLDPEAAASRARACATRGETKPTGAQNGASRAQKGATRA